MQIMFCSCQEDKIRDKELLNNFETFVIFLKFSRRTLQIFTKKQKISCKNTAEIGTFFHFIFKTKNTL